MRNENVLQSFVAYCKANPDQRFWQALRNWSGYGFVLVANGDDIVPKDTFHWEGRNGDNP